MRYAIDTEFIDTPTCSALISLALVSWDGRELYLEFDYPEPEITPWLRNNVIPHLSAERTGMPLASQMIREFVGGHKFDKPEFWAYFASHDWYWFCRVFGGMTEVPEFYPMIVRDFQRVGPVPTIYGPEHHALADAKSLMSQMKKYESFLNRG